MSEAYGKVEAERQFIEAKIKELIRRIGPIPIASPEIMPFGWRKAAKGRTVWRIVEEIISQNLEKYAQELGFKQIKAADSEVGVYDFEFVLKDGSKSYVNIKSSVAGGKRNKDDISKGEGLVQFYRENPESNLYVATFLIQFNARMLIELLDCIVFPVPWIPDVYVNPSNNGNLQSADYKNIRNATKRTNEEFFEVLMAEMRVAAAKRMSKRR